MSDVEQAAKPLLTPVIRGKSASWNAEEHTRVATWAFKTALMSDTSSVAAHNAPPEHFDYLWRHRRPPPTVQIRVARYVPRVGEKHHGVSLGVDAGSKWADGAYRISFNVGQIVFVIHGVGGLQGDGFRVDLASATRSGLWVPG
jgi:hypothetical protein